jgi:hypothetical protein
MSNGGTDPGADRPIIVQGGGSVTITSPVQFTESYDPKTGTYTYYNAAVKVRKIKVRGRRPAEHEDDSDDGKFEVRLLR